MSDVRGTFLSWFNEAALDDCEDNSFTHLTAIDSNRGELSQIGIFRLNHAHEKCSELGLCELMCPYKPH